MSPRATPNVAHTGWPLALLHCAVGRQVVMVDDDRRCVVQCFLHVYDDAAAHVMITKLYEGLKNPHTHHESCCKPCDWWKNASGQNTSHSVARIEHPLVVAVPLCVHVCHGIGPGVHLSWYCCKGTCPCGFPLMAAAVTVTECGLVCTPRTLFFLCRRHTCTLMLIVQWP